MVSVPESIGGFKVPSPASFEVPSPALSSSFPGQSVLVVCFFLVTGATVSGLDFPSALGLLSGLAAA